MRAAVCVDSLSSLNTQLRESFKERTDLGQFSEDVHSIRSPVCLLFVRPPSDLKEVKQTFDYWDFSSDTAIDIALPLPLHHSRHKLISGKASYWRRKLALALMWTTSRCTSTTPWKIYAKGQSLTS
jgi:hypothetical protein